MSMKKGQVLAIAAAVMTGVSFVAAPIVAYYSSQAATQEDISDVNNRVSEQSERMAKIETMLPVLLEGQREQQKDIDRILDGLIRLRVVEDE